MLLLPYASAHPPLFMFPLFSHIISPLYEFLVPIFQRPPPYPKASAPCLTAVASFLKPAFFRSIRVLQALFENQGHLGAFLESELGATGMLCRNYRNRIPSRSRTIPGCTVPRRKTKYARSSFKLVVSVPASQFQRSLVESGKLEPLYGSSFILAICRHCESRNCVMVAIDFGLSA
jgi:hypothetical protein